MTNKEFLSLLDVSILTDNSKIKFNKFRIDFNNKHNLYLNNLLDSMTNAFRIEPNIELIKKINIDNLKNIFIEFDTTLNSITNSKFQQDIILMDYAFTFKLIIFNNNIIINFLVSDFDQYYKYIAAILHSLNTFCYLFPYNYNGLTIYISLDKNSRNLGNTSQKNSIMNNNFSYFHQNSIAFNVSGVTKKYDNIIILTKSEEIIKLLYHEMIHYIGLDHELLDSQNKFDWDIHDKNLNLSEAYTEFLSIIFYSAYQTIHMVGLKKINKYDLFNKLILAEMHYSLYLSSNILKIYGYNSATCVNFFNGDSGKNYCPIPIWEYVLLRTQLFLNIDKLLKLIGNTWRIDTQNKNSVIELMKTDNNLLNELSTFMEKTQLIKNISYIMIDFDWNLI